ncbi:hypothetical protein [Alicyclobacillus sp. ALC3]|uniref:hypothetical protein n=1 Tax=Alicyclobacillus sp. ALC3 TaxID=2796143 RepID=UPI002378B411|nr:hypothetical protein [Alicyclobacillus sp. ALC3]WDL98491.1 hypothetical protein JC200_07370 [Alicyclobacillus sp. ALC3]
MIIDVESGKVLDTVPHAREYRVWVKLLNNKYPGALDVIRSHLNDIADSNDVLTSSWIPGSDWHGTIFEPLYHACLQNEVQAAQFYGLVLYEVMINRHESWGYGRYTTADGRQIRGLTYFRFSAA